MNPREIKANFTNALKECKQVEIKYKTFKKGDICRICIPYDICQSKRVNDGKNRFQAYSINSPEGPHNICILPENIIYVKVLETKFNPGDFVHWTPTWKIQRDWGNYS